MPTFLDYLYEGWEELGFQKLHPVVNKSSQVLTYLSSIDFSLNVTGAWWLQGAGSTTLIQCKQVCPVTKRAVGWEVSLFCQWSVSVVLAVDENTFKTQGFQDKFKPFMNEKI